MVAHLPGVPLYNALATYNATGPQFSALVAAHDDGLFEGSLADPSDERLTSLMERLIPHGCPVAVNKLVLAGADVNAGLEVAARFGQVDVCRLFVVRGACAWNAAMREAAGHGISAFHAVRRSLPAACFVDVAGAIRQAASCGNLDVVRVLADACTLPESTGSLLADGALLAAARGGHVRIVREALDSGAKIPAFSAAAGNLRVVRELLRRLEAPGRMTASRRTKWLRDFSTVLPTIATTLIARSPSPRELDDLSVAWTYVPRYEALALAVETGSSEWVDAASSGTVPHALANAGMCSAARRGDADFAQTMMRYGADAWDDSLLDAAYGGHLDVVRMMVERASAEGCAEAYVAAAAGGHLDIVRLLSDTTRTCNAEQAMIRARGDAVIRHLLVSAPHAVSDALLRAAECGANELAEELMRSHAPPENAYWTAAQANNREFLRLAIDRHASLAGHLWAGLHAAVGVGDWDLVRATAKDLSGPAAISKWWAVAIGFAVRMSGAGPRRILLRLLRNGERTLVDSLLTQTFASLITEELAFLDADAVCAGIHRGCCDVEVAFVNVYKWLHEEKLSRARAAETLPVLFALRLHVDDARLLSLLADAADPASQRLLACARARLHRL